MSLALAVLVQPEEILQLFARELRHSTPATTALITIILLHDAVREPDLRHLPLPDLLLDPALEQDAVDVAVPLLPVAVDARNGLHVRRRVPVDVEQDEAAGADEVEAHAARLGGEEEGEARAGRGAVEVVDEGLALRGRGRAVQAEEGEGEGGEEVGEEVQGGGVVGDDNDLLRRVGSQIVEELVQDSDLATGGRGEVTQEVGGKTLQQVRDGCAGYFVCVLGVEQ